VNLTILVPGRGSDWPALPRSGPGARGQADSSSRSSADQVARGGNRRRCLPDACLWLPTCSLAHLRGGRAARREPWGQGQATGAKLAPLSWSLPLCLPPPSTI
jgi:hypothetical protein